MGGPAPPLKFRIFTRFLPGLPTVHTCLCAHVKEIALEQELRAILLSVGGLAKPVSEIGVRDDLFAAGLTSFATVGVMLAIEEELDISFPDELLTRATFTSIEALSHALAGLKGQARAA